MHRLLLALAFIVAVFRIAPSHVDAQDRFGLVDSLKTKYLDIDLSLEKRKDDSYALVEATGSSGILKFQRVSYEAYAIIYPYILFDPCDSLNSLARRISVDRQSDMDLDRAIFGPNNALQSRSVDYWGRQLSREGGVAGVRAWRYLSTDSNFACSYDSSDWRLDASFLISYLSKKWSVDSSRIVDLGFSRFDTELLPPAWSRIPEGVVRLELVSLDSGLDRELFESQRIQYDVSGVGMATSYFPSRLTVTADSSMARDFRRPLLIICVGEYCDSLPLISGVGNKYIFNMGMVLSSEQLVKAEADSLTIAVVDGDSSTGNEAKINISIDEWCKRQSVRRYTLLHGVQNDNFFDLDPQSRRVLENLILPSVSSDSFVDVTVVIDGRDVAERSGLVANRVAKKIVDRIAEYTGIPSTRIRSLGMLASLSGTDVSWNHVLSEYYIRIDVWSDMSE